MIGITLHASNQTTQAEEKIPAHAHPSILGTGWECNSGYRSTGSSCEKFEVPANAHLSILGHSWECNSGYRTTGTACVPVQVPSNAHLTILGHGWECNSGYRSTGSSCEKFEVPANAHLNTLGSSWNCNDGFKQSGDTCIPMTLAEKEAQRIRNQQLMAAYLAGHREYDVSGDCDGESVSGTVEGYSSSRSVSGTLEYDSGQTVSFDGQWSGRGHIEGSDEFGNSCDLDVD